MSNLAKQLIEENLQTKNPVLDLGNCGLNGTESIYTLWKNQDTGYLKKIIFSSEWWEYNEEQKIWVEQKSQNQADKNQLIQIPEKLPLSVERLVLAGEWNNRWDITNFAFLANFTYLKSLHLRSNHLTNLAFLKNLRQLEYLDVSNNYIRDLSFLQGLTQLKYLHLSNNKVRDISFLKNVPQLEYLYLNTNQVMNISFLKYLVRLRHLDLNRNQVMNISFLQGLGQLVRLSLSWNKIIDYAPMENLKSLQRLSLSWNKTTDISFLSNLSELRHISMSHNKITDLASLSALTQLHTLSLNNNKITDITPLSALTQLHILYLGWNQIENISPLVDLSQLQRLDLKSNPVLQKLPKEIQKKQGIEVWRYWKDTYHTKESPVPIREAKVAFVGEGSVGKTSLMHLLLYDQRIESERTEEIKIHTETKKFTYGIQKEALTLRFWDFGGQEIMHATHKFFMSQRTLYVLITHGRKEEDDVLENWIEMLKSTIGDSPVILVANQLDNTKDVHRLPDTELKRQFPNLVLPVIETSWKTKRGVKKLQQVIQEVLQTMPHFEEEFSPLYQITKQKLEGMKQPYIDFREYATICKEIAEEKEESFGNDSQSLLADILNDLGIMLNFREANEQLEDLYIFQPQWIVDGVYQIINSVEAQKKKGKVKEGAITSLLKKIGYRAAQERHFIIEMMKHFKLTYQLTSLNQSYYLIPSLFDKNRPGNIEQNWQINSPLRVRFRYALWRNDYISYFLVSQHDKIQGDLYWINGAILQYGEHPVFIEAIRRNKTIQIEVGGEQDKRYALWRIREALEEVHQMFDKEKLGAALWVVYQEAGKEDEFLLEDLQIMKEEGIEMLFSTKLRKQLQVKNLLEGVNLSEQEKVFTYLQNADYAGYFKEIENVVPADMRTTLSHLKGQFVAGEDSYKFHQQLEVFARDIFAQNR